MDEEIATCIFRLFQEALTNVARHSKAKKVITSIELIQNEIIISIEDDGIGFDTRNSTKQRIVWNIGDEGKSKSCEWNDRHKLRSVNNGTSIIIKIPIKKNS